MTNTPPTFSWYAAGLVFEYLKKEGGLAAVAERNRRKAQKLYDAIDASSFYRNPVRVKCRSWMNVPFVLAEPELDGRFLDEAATAGLLNLKGHRSVGGMRASLYNAMPEAGVDVLIEFMREFERKNT
jgi:phosphoserine aminotransferase